MRDLTEHPFECPDCNSTPGTHDPSCPVGLDVGRTVEQDTAYMEAHPDVQVYTRPASWGEAQELDAAGAIPSWTPQADDYEHRDLIATVIRLSTGVLARTFGWRYSDEVA